MIAADGAPRRVGCAPRPALSLRQAGANPFPSYLAAVRPAPAAPFAPAGAGRRASGSAQTNPGSAVSRQTHRAAVPSVRPEPDALTPY